MKLNETIHCGQSGSAVQGKSRRKCPVSDTDKRDNMIRLTLPYPPTANRFRSVCNGRMIVTEEARAYKVAAGWIAKSKGVKCLSCPVVVSVDVYRPRKSGDLDNTLKVSLDSLTGILYDDDKQIVEIHARRFEDRLNPRLEITIEEKQDNEETRS